MLIVERQNRVLEILRSRKTAELEDLARELDVSASTIRRDLESLESKGLVQRTHGGAIFKGDAAPPAASVVSPEAPTLALAERMADRVAEKEAIGRFAAALVRPQMTVLLDGGSTVVYAARLIRARPIQVVTNSLSIANLFVDDDQVELLIIGGSLYPRTGTTVGPFATGCLAELHADLLLFSLAGIYGDEAFNQNLAMAQVEQAMMRQAARSVLLMDSGKFGRKSLARVCSLGEVDQIVTDSGVDASWRERLGERLSVAP
jgi:DeoR/GlpR family transcriptional regulator of sugar metabolism